jgi:hypothetical protein
MLGGSDHPGRDVAATRDKGDVRSDADPNQYLLNKLNPTQEQRQLQHAALRTQISTEVMSASLRKDRIKQQCADDYNKVNRLASLYQNEILNILEKGESGNVPHVVYVVSNDLMRLFSCFRLFRKQNAGTARYERSGEATPIECCGAYPSGDTRKDITYAHGRTESAKTSDNCTSSAFERDRICRKHEATDGQQKHHPFLQA